MNIDQKKELVSTIKEKLESCNANYFVDFKGCSCSSLELLRAELRKSEASISVLKNTLIKKAYGEGEILENLDEHLKGNTAVVWANDDMVSVAKALKDFSKSEENFAIKAGVIEGDYLDASGVEALADMPSKEESLSQLLALINTPATNLVRLLNAPATNFARLISAYKEKIE